MLLKQKNLERTVIDKLVEERATARKEKDFKKGDEVRTQLTVFGIKVFDLGDSSEWEVEK